MELTEYLCDLNLCRLCGEQNDYGVDLFPTEENEQNLSELVNRYLPLKVENDRKFPKKICPGCNIQLEATKSFIDLIIEGQNKLRQLYKQQQDKLYRQEKQRLQLEEALRNVNPNSSVGTYTIQTDDTGEKFLIQIISEGPLFPPDHELALRAEGLDRPRRKRGRPPKPPPTEGNMEVTPIIVEEVAENGETDLEETGDDGKRKRRIKVPSRYSGIIQGKELDKVFKQEGVIDVESLSESEDKEIEEGEGSKKTEEIIGRLENENGEDLGQPIVVNKTLHRPKVKSKIGASKKRRRFQCEICGREFLHYGRYTIHKKSHEVEYKCGQEECDFVTHNKEMLEEHQQDTGHCGIKPVEKVDAYGTLELPTIQLESAPADDLDATSDDQKQPKKEYKCDECNRNFTCKQNFEVHQKSVHNGEKPFTCDVCDKTFGHANTLRIHALQHKRKSNEEEGAQYKCPTCQKVFRHPSSLQYHRDSEHANGRRFVCNKCDKPFKHRQLLQRHQLVHSDERPYTCTMCSSAFKTRANLFHHSRTVHAGQRSYWCAQCGKSFVHKTALKLHQRWHNGVRPYECEFCQKTFSQKGNLAEHRRIHTGEKPYQCDHCDRAFTTSSQYRLHRKRHLDDKPHKCEHCPKRFLHKVSLKCHTRRHLDERPFKCQLCQKTFPEAWGLKKHERMHTGEKPYKCTECNKAFADSSNLAKHRRTHINIKANINKEVVYLTYGEDDAFKEDTIVQIIEPEDVLLESDKQQTEVTSVQLQQLLDQEGYPISFTTEDGQHVKVVASTEDGEENIQGLLPDGTLVPINLTPVTDRDEVVNPQEIQKLDVTQFLQDAPKDQTNIQFITEDTQNMCLVTAYNIGEIEEQWTN